MTQAKSEALRIRGGLPLRGAVRLGPDRAILETTLALAALAQGSSELQGIHPGPQLEAALVAWGQLGVRTQLAADSVKVDSPGLYALTPPRGPIECGRSPRLLAQLAGVLSGQRFGTQLRAAGCLDTPVDHWVSVLRARGAQIGARSIPTDHERLYPPVMVAPLLASEVLSPLDASLPFSDAVGKDAILLSSLFAAGPTLLSEPLVSSDHLERALVEVGLPLRRIGSVVSLDSPAWNRELPGLGSLRVPGSATLAAAFAVLVQALPGSDVTMHDVSVNPSQSGVLDVVRSWGAAMTWTPTGDAALREPIAELRVRPAAVRGGIVDAELLVRAGEAAPLLLMLGALSVRGVRFCELSALSPWQRDPGWQSFAALFASFGVALERSSEELFVPRSQWQATPTQRVVDAQDDGGRALVACTLALATAGETVVEHASGALAALYPGFIDAAVELGASIEPV